MRYNIKVYFTGIVMLCGMVTLWSQKTISLFGSSANAKSAIPGWSSEQPEAFVLQKRAKDLFLSANPPTTWDMPLSTKEEKIIIHWQKKDSPLKETSIKTSSGEQVSLSSIVYYEGVIDGEFGSKAFMTITDKQVHCFLWSSSWQHAKVIRPTTSSTADQYLLYEDKGVSSQLLSTGCYTQDGSTKKYPKEWLESGKTQKSSEKCVGIFLEVDYDVYTTMGSTANTAQYVAGLFQQVALLYAKEQVDIKIQELFIWDTPSPYSASSAAAMLGQFQQHRVNWKGQLAQLISFKIPGGIAAGFSGLCASSGQASMSYAGVDPFYLPASSYSWSVSVMAHELGHLFGLRHTHACVWNGNGTPLDDCGNLIATLRGGTPEGKDCYDAKRPVFPATNGGTIMSYCHLVAGVGIGFDAGFGEQPGNVLRNSVAQASCLFQCEDEQDSRVPVLNGCSGMVVSLKIALDRYGSETTWELLDEDNAQIAGGGPYQSQSEGIIIRDSFCLPSGCYTFRINDQFQDGICCQQGNGGYWLFNQQGDTLAQGGNFQASEEHTICLSKSTILKPVSNCVEVDLGQASFLSYAGNQDQGRSEVLDNNGKHYAYITNNAWKAIPLDYTITPNTVLAFDFGSYNQGEVHAIGLEEDLTISENRLFQLSGTQVWGIQDYASLFNGQKTWKQYEIPIGKYWQGNASYIVLGADHDLSPHTGDSFFRGIRLYENSQCILPRSHASNTQSLPGAALIPSLEQKELQIYPNPATDNIRIRLPAQQGTLYIYNAVGQMTMKTEIRDINELSVSVQTMPPGVYTAVFRPADSSGQVVGKWIRGK